MLKNFLNIYKTFYLYFDRTKIFTFYMVCRQKPVPRREPVEKSYLSRPNSVANKLIKTEI